MAAAKPFHHYYYGFAVLNFNVQPSEFWKMQPEDWWLLYNDYCHMKGMKKKNDVDVKRLKALLELPEARPSKAIKVQNGNHS